MTRVNVVKISRSMRPSVGVTSSVFSERVLSGCDVAAGGAVDERLLWQEASGSPQRQVSLQSTIVQQQMRDGLGTTHHEAGTLWMGATDTDSVTDTSGRFHHVSNAYVVGPAVFPTLGSANPSLTALALA